MGKISTLFKNAVVRTCVQAFAALCIAFTLFGLGFAMCCTPFTTNVLSNMNSNVQLSPYQAERLTALAEATRAYTVEGMDYNLYCSIENEAVEELIASGRMIPSKKAELEAALDAVTPHETEGDGDIQVLYDMADPTVARAEAAANYHEGLALTADAVSHLDDVHAVVLPALFIVGIALLLAIAAIAHLLFYNGRKYAGQAMMAGAIGIVAVLVLFAAWAVIDFDAIFSWMHSLFFADGSWTFSYSSLLICMYPEGFWMGMGVTWLLTTLIASGIVLAFGKRMNRN